ncbi:hypothetical protein GCM10022393_03180 [Aquimarina addita]|uniref:DUF11 domain-containing protein n=1 Tax=Aquimarina addita TaxID=870485 RepID=A0ABP7X8V0_9FLAO
MDVDECNGGLLLSGTSPNFAIMDGQITSAVTTTTNGLAPINISAEEGGAALRSQWVVNSGTIGDTFSIQHDFNTPVSDVVISMPTLTTTSLRNVDAIIWSVNWVTSDPTATATFIDNNGLNATNSNVYDVTSTGTTPVYLASGLSNGFQFVMDNDGELFEATTPNMEGSNLINSFDFQITLPSNITSVTITALVQNNGNFSNEYMELDFSNAVFNSCDSDGDGIENQFDLDSDNDGIVDAIEAGGTDADGDGILDGGDADNDGLIDTVDNIDSGSGTGEVTGGTPLVIPDSESTPDGLPDYLDIDADGDGIPDNIEGQQSDGYVSPGTFTDIDGDGLNDVYDGDDGTTVGIDPIGASIDPENTDGTDTVDYLDTDSDNDGILDIAENGDTDNTPSGNDADADGLDDAFDDNDDSAIDGATVNDGLGSDDVVIDEVSLEDAYGDADNDFPGAGDVDYRDIADPELTLTKLATNVSGSGAVNDVITYTFSVENTGDTIISDITIDDPLTGSVDLPITPAILAPGEIGTATATYVITQANIDAGFVENSATVSGEVPGGDTGDPSDDIIDISDDGDETVDGPDADSDPTNDSTITLVPVGVIIAEDDTVTVDGINGGTSINVVDINDTLDGIGAMLGVDVEITDIVDPDTTDGVSLDPITGEVIVLAGTPLGTYTIEYTLCTIDSPVICDSATITIIVAEPETGIVTGTVYNDMNNNGMQDSNESGISGVEVLITDVNGQTQTVITNNDGEYAAVVPVGATIVDVDETTLPAGASQTEGTDPTTVDVIAGESTFEENNGFYTFDGEIIVYSGFSPNGDGINDTFTIGGLENFPNNTLRIYNRWGVLVFEEDGYQQSNSKPFDGISNARVTVGEKDGLPEGTYYYTLEYENATGAFKSKAGYLYINR